MKIKKQQANIENLLKLIKENPELEILPMVDSECVPCADFCYWMGEWGSAEIDHYYCSDERIYFKEDDFDELVEIFLENECDNYPNSEEDELEAIAEQEVNSYAWVKAIIVKIDSP